MATQTLTADNFNDTVESNDIVLLDFWAEWCGPCKTFGPIFEEASDKHEDITFGKIDTDAEQALGQAFNIRSIPTLMVIRDGVMVFNQAGVLPAHALEDLIQQVRDLDMDEVRQQVEQAEAQQQAG